MAYDDDNERQHGDFPKHTVQFSGWTVPIDLRLGAGLTGATGVPLKPATRLYFVNLSSDPDGTALVTVATLGGQTGQTVTVPPLTMSPPIQGHFTHLLARGGTGAAGVSVIAQWAD